MLRQRFQTSHVEMGGQKWKVRNVVQDLCREIKKANHRDEQLGPEDVFSPMLPSEALKMLVSTMMETMLRVQSRWPRVESAFLRKHMVRCWKESSMKVGTACPPFFCSCDGDLKGVCHGDDFSVVARQKQWRTFGKVFEKRVEVKQTGHIGFGANDKKELKILNRTIKN